VDYLHNPMIKGENFDDDRRCGVFTRISTGVHITRQRSGDSTVSPILRAK
jgi:hypothetical protein